MPTRIRATIDPARSEVEARTERGQLVHMDAVPPHGDGAAAAPKETLLAALAGCTGMDVAALLRKKRQSASSYEILVSADAATDHPKVFRAITVVHRVTGKVDAAALHRCIELSATRYCPVSAMLSASVVIEHRYELTGADGKVSEAQVVVTGPPG